MEPELFELPPPVASVRTRNYVRPQWVGERVPVMDTDTPDLAVTYWFSEVAAMPIFDPQKEHLAALLLNTKLKCFAWNLVSIGSLNQSIAEPREIFRPTIAAAAYGMVLMHNHPSGNTSPSDADSRLTRRLVECSRLLDIRLIDHVIVGNSPSDRRFSFREAGII